MKPQTKIEAGILAIVAVIGITLTTVCRTAADDSKPKLHFATPPATNLISADRGRHLFVQSCAHCHGDDAHGSGEDSDGPDLYALRIGNARIAAVIRGGIPDEMPSFAKKHGPADIADLTAYLRTLR